MNPRHNLTGKKFGRWLVQILAGKNEQGNCLWRCQCECGTSRNVVASDLIRGNSKSCGCTKKAQRGFRFEFPEHASVWGDMISRCNNPNHKSFKYYGGRGIKVCSRWRHGEEGKTGFQCWFEDMGERPSKHHSIHRKENDKGYNRKNCIWATQHVQSRAKRNNRWFKYRGQKMILIDAVKLARSVISTSGAFRRIERGWSVKRAVETPPLK